MTQYLRRDPPCGANRQNPLGYLPRVRLLLTPNRFTFRISRISFHISPNTRPRPKFRPNCDHMSRMSSRSYTVPSRHVSSSTSSIKLPTLLQIQLSSFNLYPLHSLHTTV
ncbi:hypothetical protein V2J09_007625 [Rumex salicifolius]